MLGQLCRLSTLIWHGPQEFRGKIKKGSLRGISPVYYLSLAEIQLMFSAAQFTASFASILGGFFVTKTGGKKGLATCFLCSGLSIATWAFSSSFIIAVMLMALFSIFFYGIYEVAYGTLISSLTTPKNRATTFGVTAIMIGLFTAAGSTTSAHLWELYTPIIPFLLVAVLAFPSVLILLRVKNH
ncbi:MAG: MFS transporter [Candidatus Bathyarchaeia archaeon]|nr:MFS transporter [Candidatus Bathyarchaeia archaeon]